MYQGFLLGSQSPLFLASFTPCSTLQHLARQCSILKSFYRFWITLFLNSTKLFEEG